ncbi:hypothetical protein ACIJYF_00780 [Candidatus Pelagibacter bacterium nBUS_49]|uniref:hypothetical protein n=1 Tax=Candidatus Pelagibacter bacterium nBUS_49 TaxID=3374196 RepID=UPI003EBA0190
MNFSKKDILIDKIIHNDLNCYIKAGYGAKKISDWPFYNFILMWIKGDCAKARSLWIEWLVIEFEKYGIYKKSEGGMFQGSVHRYSLNFINYNRDECWINPMLIDKKVIIKGATSLVDRRIELIKSIMNKGYKSNLNDQIIVIKKNKFFVLKGGHHRAAILYALKYEKLPGVKSYSKFIWEVRKWMSNLKKLSN